MHDGIANQLNGDVLDGRLVARRNQLNADALQHHGLVVLLRHQFGQRRQSAVEAARRRHAVRLGRRDGLCGAAGLCAICARNFGASMICVPFSVMRDSGDSSSASAAGTCLRGQRAQQRELPVELVELDGQRQEIAAAQGAAAAQFLQ